jgi:uncharacterized iron-regulated membrane protein
MTSIDMQPETLPLSSISLYRAIWRWHFFAGLLVIPFMLNLAITGGLYLFKDEINDTFFAYRNVVADSATNLAPQDIADAALAAVPGSSLTSYREAPDSTHSALVTVATDAGNTLVYVNPHDGKVLGTVGSKEEFNWVVKRIHSLDYFGTIPNRLIEIVGGFALVLVVTGIYLWWPRQQSGGVLSIRGNPSRRVFWRDLHAVTGAIAGIVIFFLAISGLVWSGYWGANVQAYLGSKGMGYPAELWDAVPTSTKITQDVLSKTAWALEVAPVPASTVPVDPNAPAPSIGLNTAVAVARKAGIAPGFEMAVPGDETGVYTAAIYPENLANERTIHIDQYSGKPLVDITYASMPYLGRTMEWGINIHQGQEWGILNQYAMLLACVAIILSCVTAVVMWWKRRPEGRLGVPPSPPSKSVYMGLWIIAAIFGLAFPMTGIAIVAMIAFDQIAVRFIPPFKKFFA